jgi:hypothetical protein
MIRYNHLLIERLNELRAEDHLFFRIAHFWRFGTTPDLSNDVAQYRLHGIIPKYVMAYLDHLSQP